MLRFGSATSASRVAEGVTVALERYSTPRAAIDCTVFCELDIIGILNGYYVGIIIEVGEQRHRGYGVLHP
jgi:hypothetical protein